MTDYKYTKIINPKNGEKLNINSPQGKNLIKKYENTIKQKKKKKKIKKKSPKRKNLKKKNEKTIKPKKKKNDIKHINLEFEKDISSNKLNKSDLDLLADPLKKKKKINSEKNKIEKYIKTTIENTDDNNPYNKDTLSSYVASVSTIKTSLLDNLSNISGGYEDVDTKLSDIDEDTNLFNGGKNDTNISNDETSHSINLTQLNSRLLNVEKKLSKYNEFFNNIKKIF